MVPRNTTDLFRLTSVTESGCYLQSLVQGDLHVGQASLAMAHLLNASLKLIGIGSSILSLSNHFNTNINGIYSISAAFTVTFNYFAFGNVSHKFYYYHHHYYYYSRLKYLFIGLIYSSTRVYALNFCCAV